MIYNCRFVVIVIMILPCVMLIFTGAVFVNINTIYPYTGYNHFICKDSLVAACTWQGFYTKIQVSLSSNVWIACIVDNRKIDIRDVVL